jgi:hypothetical protein
VPLSRPSFGVGLLGLGYAATVGPLPAGVAAPAPERPSPPARRRSTISPSMRIRRPAGLRRLTHRPSAARGPGATSGASELRADDGPAAHLDRLPSRMRRQGVDPAIASQVSRPVAIHPENLKGGSPPSTNMRRSVTTETSLVTDLVVAGCPINLRPLACATVKPLVNRVRQAIDHPSTRSALDTFDSTRHSGQAITSRTGLQSRLCARSIGRFRCGNPLRGEAAVRLPHLNGATGEPCGNPRKIAGD